MPGLVLLTAETEAHTLPTEPQPSPCHLRKPDCALPV